MGITLFGQNSQIQKWCKQSGVHFRYRDGPLYGVLQEGRPGLHTAITVHYQPKHAWTRFTCNLPVRFPLGRTPDGLFARAMMRSMPLKYADWCLDIQESSDALLYLCAHMPTEWMTPSLFGAICRELGDEARSFHQELKDKFNFAGQFGGGHAAAETRSPGTGVPMLRPDGPPQRYR